MWNILRRIHTPATRVGVKEDPTQSQLFEHEALADDAIRLLKFKPGRPGDAIHCQLRHVPMRKTPLYIALSYVWGSNSNSKRLTVNGHTFMVTDNLHEALDQLRTHYRRFRRLYIWIDAICINQLDNVEKSRLVPCMTETYGNAAVVLCWLGPSRPGDAPALRDINRHVTRISRRYARAIGLAPPFPEELRPESPTEDVKDCLRHLIDRPWFSRVWTLQEAAADSGDCVIQVGGFSAHLSHFVTLCLETFDPRVGYSSPPLLRLLDVLPLRRWARDARALGPTNHFSERELASRMFCLLQATACSSRVCLLPHDIIYGILGLWRVGRASELPPPLRPNYEEPFERVCHQYASYLVANTGDLRYLATRRSQFPHNNLPSWVPDFRHLTASALSFVLDNEDVTVTNYNMELRAKGWELGTCKKVLRHEDPPSDGDIDCLLRWATRRITMIDREIIAPAALIQGKSFEETRYEWLRSHFTAIDDQSMMTALGPFGWTESQTEVQEPMDIEVRDADAWVRDSRVGLFVERLASCMVITTSGNVAVSIRVDNDIAQGDVVCWLVGAEEACVLRPRGNEFDLITFCVVNAKEREQMARDYISGMDGSSKQRHVRHFVIV